jgi:fructose-specific component phosphotransferase system IIB-like protein
MTRAHLVSLMALIIAIPAATVGSYFVSIANTSAGKASDRPCYIAGNAGYKLSGSASADYTVRIDNAAANPSLRMQLVDDPAAADFVLVDDGDAADACEAATAINTIRIDPAAAQPDLTVALSRAAADHKIYIRTTNYSEEDAAALFAVIWQTTHKTGQISRPGRAFAERQ